MEWSNRKYFLVNCGGWLHNLWVSELKGIKSVKIHNPYSWNINHKRHENYMVGVNSSKVNSVITIFNNAKKVTNGRYLYKEITKEIAGQ